MRNRWYLLQPKMVVAMGLLAALALGALACGEAKPQLIAGPGPRLVMQEETIDLGSIPEGQKTEARVPFRNGGDAPLRVEITALRPAPTAVCACSIQSFAVEPTEVPPGGSGEIVFVINPPEGMQGLNEDTLVDLRTNDPEKQQYTFTLKIRVV